MTKEQIDQLPAGHNLDALIAEKVMEYTVDRTSPYWALRLSPYSIEIEGAWLVVEKLKEQKYSVTIYCVGDRRHGHLAPDKEWGCQIHHHEKKPNHPGPCHERPHGCQGFFIFASAETAPLAICRAALKAVMGGKE